MAEQNRETRAGDRERLEGELFRLLVDNVQDYAIVVFDPQGRVQSWNSAAERVFGYREDEILGRPGDVFFTPEDVENGAPQCELQTARNAGRASDDRWHVRKDGSLFWSAGTTTPLWDDEGNLRGFAKIVRDRTERKQAEEQLRHSEARYRHLMEQAPFSIQVFSPEGRTVRVNRAWEELWGTRFDQIDAYNILEDPQLEAKGVLPYIRRAFAGEAVRVPAIEYDPNKTIAGLTRHQDARRWTSAIIYPLKDAGGNVREVVLIHHDVTARKRAEEELHNARLRLEAALEAGAIVTWTWDIPNNRMFSDASLARLFNLSPEEAAGGSLDDYIRSIHPDDWPRVAAALEESVASASPYEAEYRIVQPDGSIRWVVARGRVECDERGRPIRMPGVLVDITDRKRVEEALQASERQFRELADAMPQIVWAAEPDGRIDYYNRRWYEFTGARPGQTGDESWIPILHPDDLQSCLDTWYNCVRTGRPYEIEYRFRDAKTGEYRWHLGRALPVRDEQGRITRWFGTSTDFHDLKCAVDALRESQNALKAADRRKDEFLAMLAHELRNPLAPIRSGLELLNLQSAGHNETLEIMQQQVSHLVRLVDDLLDVSRIVRGRVELRREPVELSAVLRRAADSVQPTLAQRGQHLTTVPPERPVWLNADPVRLVQVLQNLLTNASKYSDDGGRIELSAEVRNGSAVIAVQDDGIGIDPELLPNVFELFTQAVRSLDRSQGGLGIGLTLVKKLVEMHGGRISAHSRGLGTGSRFEVSLPTIEPPRKAAARPAETRAAERRRVLVVDDNVGAAKMLSLLISRLGPHEVELAYDGPSALEQADRFQPDVILLDIGLPKMNGLEVARRLRRNSAFDRTHLIALTGYGQADDRRKSQEAGFNDHWVKPVNLETLKQLLARPTAPPVNSRS